MKKATAVVAIILMLCCMLSACGKGDSLVGTWTFSEDGIVMSFIFEKDGTGKVTALEGLINIEYTYEIKDGKLYFDESGQEILGTHPYTFEIKGNELSLTAGGDVMVLTKE